MPATNNPPSKIQIALAHRKVFEQLNADVRETVQAYLAYEGVDADTVKKLEVKLNNDGSMVIQSSEVGTGILNSLSFEAVAATRKFVYSMEKAGVTVSEGAPGDPEFFTVRAKSLKEIINSINDVVPLEALKIHSEQYQSLFSQPNRTIDRS